MHQDKVKKWSCFNVYYFVGMKKFAKAESDIVPSKGQDGVIHALHFPKLKLQHFFNPLFECHNTVIRDG